MAADLEVAGGGLADLAVVFRPPMTVEVTKVTRGKISAHLSVVGNLIGEATVDVAPKTGGASDHVGEAG